MVATLNHAIVSILDEPDLRSRLLDMAMVAAPSTPDELGRMIEADLVKWGGLVKKTGIRAE